MDENYSGIDISMRPLYSRKRPRWRKLSAGMYLLNIKINSMLRQFTIYTSPSCTHKPWNTDARQTEGVTCAHGFMAYELESFGPFGVLQLAYNRSLGGKPGSSSGCNQMHVWYIGYHKKMPRSSWRKFLVIDTPDKKKWSVYALNT